jgi:hypothetical protein
MGKLVITFQIIQQSNIFQILVTFFQKIVAKLILRLLP